MQKDTINSQNLAKLFSVSHQTVLKWIKNFSIKNKKVSPKSRQLSIDKADFINKFKHNNMPLPEELVSRDERVLIVDNSITSCKLLETILSREGKYTLTALDVYTAEIYTGRFKPSLIITDLNMPDKTGFELIRFIKNHPSYMQIKIIVISAQGNDALNTAIKMGADDTLSKPFELDSFLQKVSSLISLKKH